MNVKTYLLIMKFNKGKESIYYKTKQKTAKAAYEEFTNKMKDLEITTSFNIEDGVLIKSFFQPGNTYIFATRTLVSEFKIKNDEFIEKEINKVIKEWQVPRKDLKKKEQ